MAIVSKNTSTWLPWLGRYCFGNTPAATGIFLGGEKDFYYTLFGLRVDFFTL